MNSTMVLQRQPAKSAVYGYYDPSSKSAAITVTVSGSAGETFDSANGSTTAGTQVKYKVTATTDGKGRWKAYLKPSAAGGSYAISARCTSGCSGTATIKDVTFGDVW
jgi:hypothetical protein